jgi:hypothetical protein
MKSKHEETKEKATGRNGDKKNSMLIASEYSQRKASRNNGICRIKLMKRKDTNEKIVSDVKHIGL